MSFINKTELIKSIPSKPDNHNTDIFFYMGGYKERKQRVREMVKREEQERARQIQEHGYPFKATDKFRIREKEFKYYQHRKTDWSKILDWKEMKKVEGIKGEVYEVGREGAFLVKRFMDQEMQWQVGFEAMNDFVRKPYRNNLDGTNGLYLDE